VIVCFHHIYFRPKISAACFKMSFSIFSCCTSLRSFKSSSCSGVRLSFSWNEPEFSACFTHLSNREWAISYSRQISHLRLPEWYKSTNCCLNSSVYFRGFLFCFVSVILAAPLFIGFILYDLKKFVQFIVAYPLFLKVNREKTCVSHISKVKYLGYSFYNYRGKCRFRVHPKSVTKMKNRIRELTNRSNGWGNEYRALKLTQFIRGWVNYFGMADMKNLLIETDKWLRHKIRAIYWKQWKKVRTKYKELKKLGVDKEKAWICANMRNGNWYCSGYFVLQTAFNNRKLRELGYPTFTEFYLKICEN